MKISPPILNHLAATIAVASSLVAASFAQRESVAINDSWKFLKKDAPVDAEFDSWSTVSITHTWNAFDGQNCKSAEPQFPSGYHRGPAWYPGKSTFRKNSRVLDLADKQGLIGMGREKVTYNETL